MTVLNLAADANVHEGADMSMPTAENRIATWGVWKRLCVAETVGGSCPCLPMANSTRGALSMMPFIVPVTESSAPTK